MTIPKVLFIVSGDPRTSPRPAEAIRIAAGIGAWRKAEVSVYLETPAVCALGEFVDELVDEDNFTRYLPIIRDWGRPVWVEQGAPDLSDLGEASVPYEEIPSNELARRIAASTYVLRF